VGSDVGFSGSQMIVPCGAGVAELLLDGGTST
jgi:hypothetical protein